MFLLGREACFVGFKGLRLGIGNKVSWRRAVSALAIPPIAGDKFLRQEVRNFGLRRFAVVMDSQFAGQVKARMLLEFYIALHLQQAYAHIFCFHQRILQQFEAVTLALVIRMDTDGAEGP